MAEAEWLDKIADRFPHRPALAQIHGQGESPMTITCLSRDVIAGRDQAQWRNGAIGSRRWGQPFRR